MPSWWAAGHPMGAPMPVKPPDLKRRLARNVRRFRQAAGMSREELAEASGRSVRTIRRIENGEVETTLRVLADLGNGLGVDPAALLAKHPKRRG